MENKIIGSLTQEQIAELKSKHKDVYALSVIDAEGLKHICYVRRPNRRELSAASVSGQKDPLKFNEVILRQCWLAGDEDIRVDDNLFLAVSSKLADIIEIGEAELEKL